MKGFLLHLVENLNKKRIEIFETMVPTVPTVPTVVVSVGLCWVSEAVGPIAAEASHLDSIRAQSDTAISAISAISAAILQIHILQSNLLDHIFWALLDFDFVRLISRRIKTFPGLSNCTKASRVGNRAKKQLWVKVLNV